MPLPLSEEERLERTIANKRQRLRVLEREIAALEDLLAHLRRKEELPSYAQRR